MERLTYKNYMGCKDILTIDLHNDYTVIAIKSWDPDEQKYAVQLMLKENTVNKWDLIEKAESLEFNVENRVYTTTLFLKENTVDTWKLIENAENLEFHANQNTINSAILKKVSAFLEEGFFDYYIQRYEYEMNCFDVGNNLIERERLNAS